MAKGIAYNVRPSVLNDFYFPFTVSQLVTQSRSASDNFNDINRTASFKDRVAYMRGHRIST